MGWNWAVKLVQSAREEIFRRAGLPGPWLLDKQPGQSLGASKEPAKALFYYDKAIDMGNIEAFSYKNKLSITIKQNTPQKPNAY